MVTGGTAHFSAPEVTTGLKPIPGSWFGICQVTSGFILQSLPTVVGHLSLCNPPSSQFFLSCCRQGLRSEPCNEIHFAAHRINFLVYFLSAMSLQSRSVNRTIGVG